MLLLFATYSCQYEEATLEKDPLADINPVFLKHDLSAYKIKPIWKTSTTFKNTNAVEFNFNQNNKVFIPLSKKNKIQGRERLLLTLNNGIVVETIIQYIPSDNFGGDIKEINCGNFKSKSFDGEITFKKIKDNFKIV